MSQNRVLQNSCSSPEGSLMIKFIAVFLIQTMFYYSLGALFARVSKNSLSAGLKIIAGVSLSYIVIIPTLLLPVKAGSLTVAFIAMASALLLLILKINRHVLDESIAWIKKIKANRIYMTAFVSVCSLLLFVFIVMYVTPLFGHDGKVIYFLKAKILFEEGSRGIFEKYRLIPHNQYPLLLSLQEFLSLSLSFSSEPIYSSVITLILLMSVSWAMISAFDSQSKLLTGILILLIYLTLPIHYRADNGFISRYADFPLSAFLLSLCIVFFINRQVKASMLFLFSLPLIKNEGYMIFTAFIFVILLFDRRVLAKIKSSKFNLAVFWTGIFVLSLSVILKYLRYSAFEETSAKYILHNFSYLIHLPEVLFKAIIEFFNPMNFGIVNIILFVFAILLVKKRPLLQVLLLAGISLLGYGAIICLVGGDFYKTSSEILSRLNYQFTLPLMFFTAFEFNFSEENIKTAKNESNEKFKMKINIKAIRNVLAGAIVILLFIEIIFRLFWLLFFHVPFFDREGLKHLFYPEVKRIEQSYEDNDSKLSILILGGSVLYKDYGDFKEDFERDLEERLNEKVNVYNASFPAHTSLDSYYKYKMLQDKHFDFVFFYHSINELRTNNVPTAKFKDDYSHYSYYYLVNQLMSDPLSDYMVTPFTLKFIVNSILEKMQIREYVPAHTPRENWTKYGIYIKSAESFISNISKISKIAEKKRERLIIGTFANYIPEDYSRDKFERDIKGNEDRYFPVELWGEPKNINAGLILHNYLLHDFVLRHHDVMLVDLETMIPKNREFFGDVCHLTEEGCSILAEYVSSSIIKDISANR